MTADWMGEPQDFSSSILGPEFEWWEGLEGLRSHEDGEGGAG